MKVSVILFAAAATAVLAQDSVSATRATCEPHNDHWHCPSGVTAPTTSPAASVAASSAAAAAAVATSSHGHHDDHDTVSATASGVCEAHGDHWHCPPGVAEPITAPAQTTSAPAASATHSDDDDDEHDHDHETTGATCSPHGDHWHCPNGVTEPTTAPAAAAVSSDASTLATTTGAGLSALSSAPAEQSTNVAAGMPVVGAGVQGGVAAVLGAVVYLLRGEGFNGSGGCV